jgi:hypothetical protein
VADDLFANDIFFCHGNSLACKGVRWRRDVGDV